MESELLKVRVAAIHMYRFEGEEIDKRSEKARTVLVIYCCLLQLRRKTLKKS